VGSPSNPEPTTVVTETMRLDIIFFCQNPSDLLGDYGGTFE
jgi:hypothetical protein